MTHFSIDIYNRISGISSLFPTSHSAEANKMLKQLNDRLSRLYEKEHDACTFVAATTENIEDARPVYDYAAMQTVIAFAIALELTPEETEHFLKTVGFCLLHSKIFDMIIEYYI